MTIENKYMAELGNLTHDELIAKFCFSDDVACRVLANSLERAINLVEVYEKKVKELEGKLTAMENLV